MKDRYQYKTDGTIFARVKGLTPPIFARQFETLIKLKPGTKKYDPISKEVTYYKHVETKDSTPENPKYEMVEDTSRSKTKITDLSLQ